MMCNLSIIVPGLVYLQPLRLARWLYRRRKPQWQTPRQRFRRKCCLALLNLHH